MLEKIGKSVKKLILGIRNIFIREKKDHVSAGMFDNVNLTFKNLSPYSELNVYRVMLLLVFLIVFLVIILYFTYTDFKNNIGRNVEVRKLEPISIVIKNPLNVNLPQDYENITYAFRKGDTLLKVLTNIMKISQNDAYNCVSELRKVYDTSNLKVGQKIFLKYKSEVMAKSNDVFNNIVLDELKILDEDNLREIIVFRNENGNYSVNSSDIELSVSYDKYIIKITNSMYVDAIQAGIPAEIVMNLINYYSFNIDFQRDLREGDWFEVVFEVFYTETGKKVKNGDVIYANLYANRTDHKIYRFSYDNVKDYFDKDGLSTKKSLLRTPISGARISSGYSRSRKHPILG
ncbi:MAG: hypothetical protein LBS34_01535, partial [Rickettsiales bacterium]|nr:hypothetical protein [Rickettsiales bacterium]